ncbi:hypothetical protein Vadar_000878 [Vaccinium darrowii]|uniref:Uncharacterized protein n=1 Tax=Vaccinium darrowii TaxID=229202 RepID=A0ACB7Z8U5_9ERIC|nr:hypothetical protein Vadar_000878 [Vaccinium darrowii]
MECELAAIVIDTEKNEGAESQPNTASSSQVKMKGGTPANLALGNEEIDSTARSSKEREANEIQESTEESQQKEEREPDDADFEVSLSLIERRLQETYQLEGEQGLTSSISIFRMPQRIVCNVDEDRFPELVSIGPYHRGEDKLLKFESHKWFFLRKALSRSSDFKMVLSCCLRKMRVLEEPTRRCYEDINPPMESHDFTEMMLLDGCFIIQLLRHLGSSDVPIEEHDPIFGRPWLIPVLIKDLLKLENQLPFFVLESLFDLTKNREQTKLNLLHLPTLALEVFDLTFPWPTEIPSGSEMVKIKHLLDLFYSSHLPPNLVASCRDLDPYPISSTSIKCATQLKLSGIEFKTKKANSFLDIEFKNRVLEIPTITVNDVTRTLLLNCVAFELCKEDKFGYFADYVCFMNCLIKQPGDVASLCLDGIITTFSEGDQYVADLFNYLAKSIDFNVRRCYLSQKFRDIESYYSSHRATVKRTYFSTPWSVISVFSAFLIIILTLIQTIMSIVIRPKVCLASFHIPKQDVAEGFVVRKGPLLKIDGVPLGLDFWKVMVDKAIKPNALLERTRQGVTKVGDAMGVYVAWRSSDL